MAHGQEQTRYWQTSWPPGGPAPQAEHKPRLRVTLLFKSGEPSGFITSVHSLSQCKQPPELPLGLTAPPAGWHTLRPSWTKLPVSQVGHQPLPDGDSRQVNLDKHGVKQQKLGKDTEQ